MPRTRSIDPAPSGLTRRRLLWGSAGALVAALHGRGGRNAAAELASPGPAGPGTPARIAELELASAAPLPAMRAFYGDDLGLPVAERPGELTVTAGASRLTFRPAGPDDRGAFYHFAFNVPENKILAARAWQLERTPLIPPWESLRDPRLPGDVVHFRHWDAHSTFFWDPAGNLVEHIARHTLGNAAVGPFTSADILCASEIGLIVDDVAAAAATLRRAFGLEDYRDVSDRFNALGDEHGLLLVMKRGRELGFGEGKSAGIFPTAATIRASGEVEVALPGYPYRLRSG